MSYLDRFNDTSSIKKFLLNTVLPIVGIVAIVAVILHCNGYVNIKFLRFLK